MGNFVLVLERILYAFQQCKNFENRLRFDKVTESLQVGPFFETQCICDTVPLQWLNFCVIWRLSLSFNCFRIFCICRQQGIMFPGRTSVHPSVRCASVDTLSLYLLDGFQWNLPQIFTTWVGIAEKVFKVMGSKVKVIGVQVCEWGILFDGVASRLACFGWGRCVSLENYQSDINAISHDAKLSWFCKSNKKLSYPQRKRASNMALLYDAKGISIWNPHGSRVWQCSGAICRMNIKRQVGNLESCGTFDSLWPVF